MGLNILMSEYYLAHPWKQMELGQHPEKVDVVWPHSGQFSDADCTYRAGLKEPWGRNGFGWAKFTEGLGLGSG